MAKEPSEAGNWVGVFARAVGDGDAEVGGHVFGGAGGCGADAGEDRPSRSCRRSSSRCRRRCCSAPRRLARRRPWSWASASREPVTPSLPLPPGADGPIDRGALADFVLPVIADFGEIVGPNIGGAAAVGAVNDDDVLIRERFTPLLALAIRGSFHLVTQPRKM